MQKLTSEHGPHQTLAALRFSDLRLRSRPDTKPLAEEIASQRQALWKTVDAHDLAREVRQAATAEIGWFDTEVNESVMGISRQLLVDLNNDRSSPIYLKLFKEAPSTLIRPVGGKAQAKAVNTILVEIRDGGEVYASVQALADQLKERQETLVAAEARREELYLEEGRKQTDLTIAMDQAQRVYNTNFHRLSLAFPDKPALVNSFFKELRASSASKDEPEA